MAAAAGPSCGVRLDTGEPRLPLCTFERSWDRKIIKKKKEHNDINNGDYYTHVIDCAPYITHEFIKLMDFKLVQRGK